MNGQGALDLGLPDVDVVPVETLSPDARRTARARMAIANGRHPFGRALLACAPGAGRPTCGDCVNRVQIHGGNRQFWKCPLVGGTSHSAASDLRLRWPACDCFDRDYGTEER